MTAWHTQPFEMYCAALKERLTVSDHFTLEEMIPTDVLVLAHQAAAAPDDLLAWLRSQSPLQVLTAEMFFKHRMRFLNYLARTAMGIASRVYMTAGIMALPLEDQSAIREAVEKFDDFNPDNDPHEENDFGIFTHQGSRIYWKIDYYDRQMEFGSENPANPYLTTRVLTIMLANEY